MAAKHNIFGQVYDDSQPCFLDIGNGFVLNRVNNRELTLDGLLTLGKRIGYAWSKGEIEGYPKPKKVKKPTKDKEQADG